MTVQDQPAKRVADVYKGLSFTSVQLESYLYAHDRASCANLNRVLFFQSI